MNLVFGQDAQITAWAAERIPHVDSFGDKAVAIGIAGADGMPAGAVIYHEYRGNDIQMSCAAASRRWLSRGVLRALFFYPFEQLKVERVTAFAPAQNQSTRHFLEGIGFKMEGIMRRGFKNDDCVLYGMLKHECKWLKGNKNG